MNSNNMELLASTIMINTLRNGGNSVGINGKDTPTGGFMVSQYPQYTKIESLKVNEGDVIGILSTIGAFIMNHEVLLGQNGLYIGTWIDNDQFYVDISTNVSTIEQAEQMCKEHSQIAYHDIVKGVDVNVNF